MEQQANPIMAFAPMIFIFVIFYFLLIRPQQKKQKEHQNMIKGLKKGDKVVTAGGIIGTIHTLQDDYVVIKVGEGESKLEILRTHVSDMRK